MKRELPSLVLIGASTGGPGVLRTILSKLPKRFSSAVIIAQHMHAEFLDGLAEWLSSTTGHSVVIPRGGEPVEGGKVYLAGTKGNLSISPYGTFLYLLPSTQQTYVPSIDALFSEFSGANSCGAAFLLTGMGDDGSIGLDALHRLGWRTYVQTRSTCAVDGMPSAALNRNLRHDERSPEQIGTILFNLESMKKDTVCQKP